MKHIVLIPAYQPDEALLRLVLTMRLYGLTVIVVDDGSGEDYARVFRLSTGTAVYDTQTGLRASRRQSSFWP